MAGDAAMGKEAGKDPVIHVLKNGLPPREEDDLQPAIDAVSRRLFNDVAPSIVKIQCEDGSGSGFFADARGDIATNAHVVLGCDKISVITADGKSHDARIVKLDDINDLAVLRIDPADKTAVVKPLHLGSSKHLQADQSVWALGHPGGSDATYISPGYFRHAETALDVLNGEGEGYVKSAKKLMENMTPKEFADAEADLKRPLVNASVNIQKGDSGGALVDATGKVVGINDLSNLESNSDFIPVEKLKALLKEPPKFKFTYKHTDLGLTLTDITRSDGSYRAPFVDNLVIQTEHSKAPNAVPKAHLNRPDDTDNKIDGKRKFRL